MARAQYVRCPCYHFVAVFLGLSLTILVLLFGCPTHSCPKLSQYRSQRLPYFSDWTRAVHVWQVTLLSTAGHWSHGAQASSRATSVDGAGAGFWADGVFSGLWHEQS